MSPEGTLSHICVEQPRNQGAPGPSFLTPAHTSLHRAAPTVAGPAVGGTQARKQRPTLSARSLQLTETFHPQGLGQVKEVAGQERSPF